MSKPHIIDTRTDKCYADNVISGWFVEDIFVKIFIKFICALIALFLPLGNLSVLPAAPDGTPAGTAYGAKSAAAAAAQNSMPAPWAEEISNNGAYAAVISVPPVIRVANAGYGLDNQGLTASDSSTIQTQLINYSTRSMQSYDTTVSVTVPAGASVPALTAATQGAGAVNIAPVNVSGNPYTWQITGGTAVAGNYISYTVTYALNGRQYTQKAASYIDFVELAAGWQNYVVRRNFSDVTHTRHEYTAVLSGSCSTGAGYAVYGSGGTGYYKMYTGGGSGGFVAGPAATSGMKIWDPGYDDRDNCSVWYCGQPGKKPGTNDDNVDGGHRAYLDVYYDPSVVTNISQLGIKLLYWRSTSPPKTPTMYQEKMIYLLGNPIFNGTDSSNATAQSYFYSTNAQNNRSQSISTDPGFMTFNFAGTTLPPDGQKVTYASAIYGNFQQEVHLTTWDAWLITFHVVNKSALRALIAAEDAAFRQIHDGYTNTDGSFTAYLNQLAQSKAVLNQPNATPAQIATAVSDLNTAKNNFKYVQANYEPLNILVGNIYNPSLGFRPSPVNDPDYYYFGVHFYPSVYYDSTSEIEAALACAVYGLDVRYRSYVDAAVAELNSVWRTLVLLNADYSTVNDYMSKISGLNDMTGSEAGNYILADGANYPQYAGQMMYWRNFTQASYDTWETAVYGVTLGLKIPDQASVTAMAEALQTAHAGLVIKPADYSALNILRAAAQTAVDSTVPVLDPAGEGYQISLYSAESVSAIQSKLSEMIDGLLIPEQPSIILWTDELQAVFSSKTLNNADYTYADSQKAMPAAYEAEADKYYTPTSLQALLDARAAVVPGKSAGEQDVVNAWALQIYSARNALVFNPADYTGVDYAVAAANALNPAVYQNWTAVKAALNSVIYGLDITQQTKVDEFAADINTAVADLIEVVVTFEANPGSTAVIDSARGYIYGLPANGMLADLAAQGYLDITGNGYFVYTPASSGFGTGTKVELVREADSKVMAVYTLVIFGDANGDGFADGRDAVIANMLSAGMLTQGDAGDAAYFAADANHDGIVDALDALLLEQAGLFLAAVNQTPG